MLIAADTIAQVFDPGPSNPALFTTVVDLPPAEDIRINESIGGVEGETIQLNLGDGGVIGTFVSALSGSEVNIRGGQVGGTAFGVPDTFFAFFNAESGSEVNVSGGRIGPIFNANAGSLVNISGGSIEGSFTAESGSVVNLSGGIIEDLSGGQNVGNSFAASSDSQVNISGGSVRFRFVASPGSNVSVSGGDLGVFEARSGSRVELIGSEFRLNGSAYTDTSITLSTEDVFTGTLINGAAFVFSPSADDLIEGVILTPAVVPQADLTPMEINSPVGGSSVGLRAGQALSIKPGGQLGDNFATVDASLTVEGGSVGDRAEVAGGVVNVTGGIIGDEFQAHSGSRVNADAGMVGSSFTAHSGSVVSVSGAVFGSSFEARPGSTVRISGGSAGSEFSALDGSAVEFLGGEFRLNGVPFIETHLALSGEDVFTGTLADGSAFIFSAAAEDRLEGIRLTAASLPQRDLTPIVIDTRLIGSPIGLRAGQVLTVVPGGELGDSVAVVGGTLNIQGGVVGDGAEVAEGVVNVNDGSLGLDFKVYLGSQVNISDGSVGRGFEVYSGSVVNIAGGSIGSLDANSGSEVNISGGNASSVHANAGSVINVSGGNAGNFLRAGAGSVVNITGGAVGNGFRAEDGSQVNISGGSVGDSFVAQAGSLVNISGGQVDRGFEVSPGSKVSIRGGMVQRVVVTRDGVIDISGGEVNVGAANGSRVNFFGTDFLLDGEQIDTLTPGEAFVISQRDVTFSGVLADGSPFSFRLNAINAFEDVFFARQSILTVTLVPEPTSAAMVFLLVFSPLALRRRG